MKISYNWLRQFISLSESPEKIAELLTNAGLEVEKTEVFETIKGGLKGIVLGKVVTCEKHPGADKLKKTTVDIGSGALLPIVCGASNVEAGQKVLVATVGTTLYPTAGESFKISKAKIRGEASEGMICAEDEIGLGSAHEGIMVIDTDLPIGTSASEILNIENDVIFEIGLTPNRADAASHLGVARDLQAILQKKVSIDNFDKFKIDNTSKKIEVSIENPAACPRYSGLTISNIKVAPSPEWLQNKLKSIDVNPINNIVDITNYILHDLGQPLHAFDLDKISGNRIVVKTLSSNSTFVTLDGIQRNLSQDDLMICNEQDGMCIAGVFGGKNSGVTNETKSIFLESAYFSPDSIRKTSQLHGLKTDASFRYERGTDPEITVYALKKAALLIQEIAGGEISSEIIDIYPHKIDDFDIDISYQRINELIGKDIPSKIVKSILEGLNITIVSENDGLLKLKVPSYKVDVQREADIVEEILRIYGYNNIELSSFLQTSFLAEFPDKDKVKFIKSLSSLLVAKGFFEITTNSLTSSSYPSEVEGAEKNVVILNALSEGLDVLRSSLLFSGLEVVAHNINRRNKDLKLFEFGKTYLDLESKFSEKERLSIFITGDVTSESWHEKSEQVDLFYLKQVVTEVLTKVGLKEYNLKSVSSPFLSSAVNFEKNGKIFTTMGVVKSSILKSSGIRQNLFYADIDFEYLLKNSSKGINFSEISKFPEVRRDLSIVMDKNITFDQIRAIATKQEKRLIKDINVFDVYQGDKIEKEKKSYSVSFTLLDHDQTLTDKVIDKTMQNLINAFEKELGAIIRK